MTSVDVRQVVAWLPTVRAATCALVWVVFAVAWFVPSLDLPLREITALGLTAAICRTLVVVDWHQRGVASTDLVGPRAGRGHGTRGGPAGPDRRSLQPVHRDVRRVRLGGGRAGVATMGPADRHDLAAGIRVAGVRPPAGGEGGTPPRERPADAPVHDVACGDDGRGTGRALRVGRRRGAGASVSGSWNEARERAARSEALASLATMAAGAAHELSTPLGTIALVARELQRNVEQTSVDVDALREDARLMRAEVERCRVILDGMSGRARGDTVLSAEPLPPVTLAQMAEGALTDAQRQRLRVEIAPGTGLPGGSGTEVAQALTLLLRNAFDASGGDSPVELRFRPQEQMVRMEIHDQGPGMSEETLRRAGEPFYTTKEPGSGLGLGLFLVRTFAERAGGNLRFEVGGGTTAILEVPSPQTPAGTA